MMALGINTQLTFESAFPNISLSRRQQVVMGSYHKRPHIQSNVDRKCRGFDKGNKDSMFNQLLTDTEKNAAILGMLVSTWRII